MKFGTLYTTDNHILRKSDPAYMVNSYLFHCYIPSGINHCNREQPTRQQVRPARGPRWAHCNRVPVYDRSDQNDYNSRVIWKE